MYFPLIFVLHQPRKMTTIDESVNVLSKNNKGLRTNKKLSQRLKQRPSLDELKKKSAKKMLSKHRANQHKDKFLFLSSHVLQQIDGIRPNKQLSSWAWREEYFERFGVDAYLSNIVGVNPEEFYAREAMLEERIREYERECEREREECELMMCEEQRMRDLEIIEMHEDLEFRWDPNYVRSIFWG